MLSQSAFDYFLDQYDESFCNGIIEHCMDGKSPESYAAVINSTPEVFAYWANRHMEFEICLHIAFWKSFAWWEGQLKTNPDIDARTYKLVMSQRFKWREDGQDIQRLVKNMNDRQLEDLARRLLDNSPNKPVIAEVDDEDL